VTHHISRYFRGILEEVLEQFMDQKTGANIIRFSMVVDSQSHCGGRVGTKMGLLFNVSTI
jgi:hypothetical protein